MTNDELRNIAALVRKDAEQKRIDAGFSGSMSDNGAILIDQVDIFLAGLEGRVPTAWQRYADQAALDADPEYAEYKRLHAKFDGAKRLNGF